MSKKLTQRERIIELLQGGWYSNYQIQQEIKSSSADREARRIRECPPVGYTMVQRQKKIDGYNTCLEFHLQATNSNGQIPLF